MKPKNIIISIVICFAASGATCAQHFTQQKPLLNSVYKFNTVCATPCVSLTGTVKYELNYGPPGYGETPKIDGKVVDYILVLDHEIDIKKYIHANSATNVREIQLFLPLDNDPLSSKIGRVEVRGTLEKASTAAAVRYYTLIVCSLKYLKKRATAQQ